MQGGAKSVPEDTFLFASYGETNIMRHPVLNKIVWCSPILFKSINIDKDGKNSRAESTLCYEYIADSDTPKAERLI